MIRGLLIEETGCREVTRSVSEGEPSRRPRGRFGFQAISQWLPKTHHRMAEKTGRTSRRDHSRASLASLRGAISSANDNRWCAFGDHRLMAENPPGSTAKNSRPSHERKISGEPGGVSSMALTLLGGTLLSGTVLAAGEGRTKSRVSPAASAVPLSELQLK